MKIENIFDKKLIEFINDLTNSFEINSNIVRADMLSKKIRKYGWYEIGCGTNRIVFEHNKYSEIVVKIPLDNRGIADNNAEEMTFKRIQRYVPQLYTNINGLILISEKVYPFKKYEIFKKYENEVNIILNEIKHVFVLNDVSPESFKNWGIDRNGNLVILDYAYLTLLKDSKYQNCISCKGQLDYTKDGMYLECKECHRKYSIVNITGTYEDTLREEFDVVINNEIPFRYDILDKEDNILKIKERL